jgi:hypothetical protein
MYVHGHSFSNIALFLSILSGISVLARRCLWSGMGLGEFLYVCVEALIFFDKLG